jgi:hypothetical protein
MCKWNTTTNCFVHRDRGQLETGNIYGICGTPKESGFFGNHKRYFICPNCYKNGKR